MITVEYRVGGRWTSRSLTEDEYYDPGEDPIERHDHAVDYLDVDRATLEATRLTVDGVVIVETFWNDGRSRVIERSDTGEIIVDARIDGGRHVLRLVRKDGELRAVSDSVLWDDR